MEYIIETKNLCKSYEKKAAVTSLNMHVPSGEIYGFIGRNGSGKSTTLKMLCGLVHPTEGSIRLFGETMLQDAVYRRIGVLIETAGLEPGCTAYENMLYKAMFMGIVEPKKQIQELLTQVGLEPENKKKVKQFSMGMKQRLGIAMALLGGPDLLILDEPINGLDPEGMNQIRNLLVDLNQKKGITILISSHILGELEKMATHYGILKDGYLVKEISREDLISQCKDYLYLKVQDSQMAAVVLEQQLGLCDYEVHPDGEIRIFQNLSPAHITSALSKAGISVYAIYPHQQDLEGYFMELMGQDTQKSSSRKGGRHHA